MNCTPEANKEESTTTFKMSSVDWAAINEKLPFERTDEAKEKRRELFKQFDPNGNGYLSLAEVIIQDCTKRLFPGCVNMVEKIMISCLQ